MIRRNFSMIGAITPEEILQYIKQEMDCFHSDYDDFSSLFPLIDELNEKVLNLQSKIDSLMFEYCPNEMTQEQIQNYEKYVQKVIEPLKILPFIEDHGCKKIPWVPLIRYEGNMDYKERPDSIYPHQIPKDKFTRVCKSSKAFWNSIHTRAIVLVYAVNPFKTKRFIITSFSQDDFGIRCFLQ